LSSTPPPFALSLSKGLPWATTKGSAQTACGCSKAGLTILNPGQWRAIP